MKFIFDIVLIILNQTLKKLEKIYKIVMCSFTKKLLGSFKIKSFLLQILILMLIKIKLKIILFRYINN